RNVRRDKSTAPRSGPPGRGPSRMDDLREHGGGNARPPVRAKKNAPTFRMARRRMESESAFQLFSSSSLGLVGLWGLGGGSGLGCGGGSSGSRGGLLLALFLCGAALLVAFILGADEL